MFERVLKGGTIVDGTGKAGFVADLAVDGGKIAAMGTHDELLETNEVYRETYLSQNNMGGEENGSK